MLCEKGVLIYHQKSIDPGHPVTADVGGTFSLLMGILHIEGTVYLMIKSALVQSGK